MGEKKLKTYVNGLDVLLNWNNNTDYRPDDMLIVLRGDRGISKMNLAMQMMIGVSEYFGTTKLPVFYSLDKNTVALRNKYEKIKGDSKNIEEIFPMPKQKTDTYLYSKLIRFNTIMQDLEAIPENDKVPCMVIEGFAGLSSEDFARLPMDTLEEALRKKVHVGILVFDNRLENSNTSADIIIEMRRAFNAQHNYTNFELQIAKNFFRSATNGWHKYRCEDNGKVVVYPSLHKILSKLQPKRSEFERLLTNPKQCPINGIECDGRQA